MSLELTNEPCVLRQHILRLNKKILLGNSTTKDLMWFQLLVDHYEKITRLRIVK